MDYFNLLYFVLACLVMFLSGSFLVRSLILIARFLRLSEFIAAFIIMAFSTSLPELFVGISSALQKTPALSLGNVIGSNIADVALVGGIILLIARTIKIENKTTVNESMWAVLIAILPLVLMLLGNQLSRIDGALLVIVFLVYSWNLAKQTKKYSAELENHVNRWLVVGSVFVFIFGLVLLFFSSGYVVEYGKLLALDLLLPPIFVGLFFVAIGTSMPELVFETRSILTGHKDFALGDLLGSIVCNSTLVLGVTALIYPIQADFFLFLTSAIFMVVMIVLFAAFIETRKLSWKAGIGFLLLYLLFIIVELSLKGTFYGVG